MIRASSAHSWVEAYFAGYGWVSFDPTPGAPLGSSTGWNRVCLYIDAMASFWREWVVNYDASHQKSLGEDAMQGSRSFLERIRGRAERWYARMVERARRRAAEVLRIAAALGRPGRADVRFVVGGGQPAPVAALDAGAKPGGASGECAQPGRGPVVPANADVGWTAEDGRKTEAQTPQEFLTRIEDPIMHERVENFTRAYEAARFGESPEEARRLPELYEEITTEDRR